MKLSVIGASGHGKVVADIARLLGYNEIVFYDDNPSLTECGGWPVVGSTNCLEPGDTAVFVAIGNPEHRSRFMKRFRDAEMPVLVHPNAIVAADVCLGRGSVVMAGAVINPGSRAGEGVIVNTCASVDHDCVLGDYVHVAVGAHLCGLIHVGEKTWIGAGAIISNGISVCQNCMIGAGAIVIRDLSAPGTYIGIPAKLHKSSMETEQL
ncbi:MAG: acetyltransferase [Oscillospiraceae bacterium]|nr:acetyltransferase [Oscillospiraceae bacterium]